MAYILAVSNLGPHSFPQQPMLMEWLRNYEIVKAKLSVTEILVELVDVTMIVTVNESVIWTLTERGIEIVVENLSVIVVGTADMAVVTTAEEFGVDAIEILARC